MRQQQSVFSTSDTSPSSRSRKSSTVENRHDHKESRGRAIRTTRVIFTLSLLALAAVLGFCVYYFFSQSEQKLAYEQFDSIAGRAKSYAQETARLKRLGVITMAAMIGNIHPNADQWPFVIVEGYEETATRLVQTISGDGMGFAPIVGPSEIHDFEAFAYDAYENVLGYSNTTAISSFGKGVWAKDITGEFNIAAKDQKYHEATVHPNATTIYGSEYPIFTPVLQHSDGANAKPLMLNLHYERVRGQTIDNIIRCAEAKKDNDNSSDEIECGQISDLVLLTQRRVPAGLFMQPIFPRNNRSTITGIISSPMVFHDVLDNAFGDVSGIHCVLTSNTGEAYTYYVEDGNVNLMDEKGDLHDTNFDEYEDSIVLTDEESGLYSNSSSTYSLKLYPSQEFMNTYQTINPLVGCILSVIIILFTTLLFYLYDSNVRNEFSFKNDLLEAKRAFIRFVSHEVRTPLNAVCMGLTLMRDEIDKALKATTTDEAEEKREESSKCTTPEDLKEWREVTDEVLGNAQNAVDVLNDLLNYDKISTGSLKLELSLLDINYLMEHAVKEFKLPAAKKQIHMEFTDIVSSSKVFKQRNLCLVGDGVRLVQVLRNLMSNSLKFTPQKGTVRVELSWTTHLPDGKELPKKREKTFNLKNGDEVSFQPFGFIQLSVSDTGAGMSEDQMASVFQQGTQFNVNELQAGQGSGLGLFIAKGIMDQHLGSLTVSSEGLGKGTTFTMSLPVYYDTERSNNDVENACMPYNFKAAKSSAVAQADGSNPLRILVVDDSDTNRKFLTRILANRGHTCEQAKDGSDAVKMVSEAMENDTNLEISERSEKSQLYDAVLLDYEMPTMDGPTAANEMRKLGCDTFIVGITGNLLPEDIDHFRCQGANEVLPKPFNISDLEEIFMEYGVGGRNRVENIMVDSQ